MPTVLRQSMDLSRLFEEDLRRKTMSVRKPAAEFSRIWYQLFWYTILMALPLEYLIPGFGWWVYATGIGTWGGVYYFGGVEQAAEVLRHTPEPDSGTMTSWLFWKVKSRFVRVAFGVSLGLLLRWRLADLWYLDDAVWFYFQTWLPYHYWSPKIRGPWEWVGQWVKDSAVWAWEKVT